MRFFHLSDLHIGKQLHYYNLREDQKVIMDEIIDYARAYTPDAILISGDIYDKSVPSAEAVTVFDDFLTRLSEIEPQIFVLIISGNHDNAQRLEYAAKILRKHKIYVAGHAPRREEEHIEKVTFTDEYGEIDVYMLPFLKPTYVKGVFEEEPPESYNDAVTMLIEREKIDFKGRRNILMSHQFYTGANSPEICDSETISVGGIDNVNTACVQDFDYVALGHLHGRQQVGEAHIRYCGTPLKYSVSEAAHKKCLTMVTIEKKGEPLKITELLLHPLRDVKKKRGELADIIEQAKEEEREDYISVTLTDETEPYLPKEQLKEVYSHVLEIRVDNTRTRKQLMEFEERVTVKDPFEAFEDFYEEVQGKELKEEEQLFMKHIFEKIEEE